MSPFVASRMKSEGFPSGEAVSRALRTRSQAAASPSRRTPSGGVGRLTMMAL